MYQVNRATCDPTFGGAKNARVLSFPVRGYSWTFVCRNTIGFWQDWLYGDLECYKGDFPKIGVSDKHRD